MTQPRLIRPAPAGWRDDPIRCGECGQPPPEVAPGDERVWEHEL